MTAGFEAALPGATRRLLEVGPLSFTAWEMGTGPLVLLLHGFPDGPETWRDQLPFLADAGFRAVAVTLRGYEPSSIPLDGDLRVETLAADVLGWMDALGEARAHLIGHDWGATLAYAAAMLASQRILSLAMLAVPQPVRLAEALRADRAQMRRSSYIVFFQLRGLADAWLGFGRAALVERLWRRWSPGWDFRARIDQVRRRFGDPRVRRCALDYYRRAATASGPSLALLAAPMSVPTLGLTGTKDGCISADVFARSMRREDFPAGLTVVEVPGTGHFLHAEQPDAVNRQWLAFAGRVKKVEAQ